MKSQKTLEAKTIFRKKNRDGGITVSAMLRVNSKLFKAMDCHRLFVGLEHKK